MEGLPMYPDLNKNSTSYWKNDTFRSVDTYNSWFLKFAPVTFKNTRNLTKNFVRDLFKDTNNLSTLTIDSIKKNPKMLSILRMATCPPLARERISGFTNTPISFINSLENGKLPTRSLDTNLSKIGSFITKMLDDELMPWLKTATKPTDIDVNRASIVIADRLVGTMTNPIIRNAQEKRQLNKLEKMLVYRGYKLVSKKSVDQLNRGDYAIHINVPTNINGKKNINVSIDLAFIPLNSTLPSDPILIEAKSAGDYTNVNKRRKEEATKISQLKVKYPNIKYILLLTGYFDAGYLGYEAAEGIDWIWEHRMADIIPLIRN